MNYIILNGIKSTSIKGLLIQELPPISKPQIRVETETIDGRDGDIITKLGYSAYDKNLSIGLHGDYNVDDIIKYFDSEGDVVFSNELDKYYRYQIVDNIDFERLIRFKTATVKMHVQPFKYDAVDREIIAENQLIDFKPWSSAKNSLTMAAANGVITVTGTADDVTEFYMPIEPLTLDAGNYTLTANVNGTAEGVAIRLISGSPSKANSFGGNYLSLKNNSAVTLTADDTGAKTYNYLWFYVPYRTVANFTLTVTFSNKNFSSLKLNNRGNIDAKPKITIYGSGTVEISLNGTAILSVNIDDNYITIDSAEMNAYHDGTLKNRQVTGDYANLILKTGENILSWNGNVSEIKIDDFSRWI